MSFKHTDRDTIEHGRTIRYLLNEVEKIKGLITKAPRGSQTISNLSTRVIQAGDTHTTEQNHLTKEELNFYDDNFHVIADKDLTAPPGTIVFDTKYIVGASATGDWSGEDKNIATYTPSGWVFLSAVEGKTVYAQDENLFYYYTGSAWANVSGLMGLASYLLIANIDDTPVNSETSAPISSNWAFDHAANPTNVNHLTDAQVTALHAIYTISTDLLDEDDMSSDSAVKVPSQQSVKAYIDTFERIGSGNADLLPTSFVDGTNYNDIVEWANSGASAMNLKFKCDEPPLRSGLSLNITGFEIDIANADANDFIDTVNIYALSHNAQTSKYSDTASNVSTVGRKVSGTDFDAVTPFDASTYRAIFLQIIGSNTTAADLEIRGVWLKGYYA